MPRRPRSLARDLLILLVAVVALTWLVTAVLSYVDARHELDELLDAHLTQAASLLLADAQTESRVIDEAHAPQLHRYSRRVAFQLWENGSRLAVHSANAPDAHLSREEQGFSDVSIDGTGWRVFSAWDPERRFLVQVGELASARNDIVDKIAQHLLVPFAVALPALALAIGFGIRRALRPLRRLNEQVEARAPGNLAPVQLAGAPAEVAPLVTSLNRLFERVHESIENERRFTADAAHELRTPLAALRAQAQVARGSTDDAERRHALDNVIAGCDRATHLVQQLLTLARLEPDSFRARREPCDLGAVLQQTIAEIAPSALAKDVEIELDSPGAAQVSGDARLLGVMFRNVIENAVNHGPPRAMVRVSVRSAPRGASVTVADTGPGVPADERGKLGRRFHRLLGSEAPGTGLGLSIVRRIAELHGAAIEFGETAPGVGLAVTITLPAAA